MLDHGLDGCSISLTEALVVSVHNYNFLVLVEVLANQARYSHSKMIGDPFY